MRTTEYFSKDEVSSFGDQSPRHLAHKLKSSHALQDLARKSKRDLRIGVKSRKMSNLEGILEKEFREVMGLDSEH